MLTRPDLDDYEYYDPQSMQQYAYRAEGYIDEVGEIIIKIKNTLRDEELSDGEVIDIIWNLVGLNNDG